MDKKDTMLRMIVFAVLAMIIMLGWQKYFAPKPELPQPKPAPTEPAWPGAGSTDVSGQPSATTQPPVSGAAATVSFQVLGTPPPDAAARRPVKIGDTTYRGRYAMAVWITPQGAAIRRLELSDYFASVDDRDKDFAQRQRFQLVRPDKGAASFRLVRLDLAYRGSDRRDSIAGELADAWWTQVEPRKESEARFKLDINRDGEKFLTLYRTYRLGRRTMTAGQPFGDGSEYTAEMIFEFEDHTGTLAAVALTMRGPEGLVREDARTEGRMVIGGFVSKDLEVELKTAKDAASDDDEKRRFSGGLDWAGAVDKYFALIVSSDPNNPLSPRFDQATSYAYEIPEGKKKPTKLAGIEVRSNLLRFDQAGGKATAVYMVLGGPKDSHLLSKPLLRDRGLLGVISYSGRCFFNIPGVSHIAKGMVWAIDEISGVVGNKGLAVIILVLIVRLLMLPVTRYSQLSMLRMQELAPEIAKLKEQFKDDQKRVQVETMKLYREHGANPMLGCAPMALQMPIWIALYTGIRVAISLRHAPFVLWIQDLSLPDRMLTFAPVGTPIISYIGNWANWQLNVLPLLMIVAMFLQMRLQPQSSAGSTEMARQQKMMKFMMPAMLLFFLYSAPSALNLYILTSSVYGFCESKYIRWHHAQLKLRPPKPRKEKKKGMIGRWLESQMSEVERLQKSAKKSENPFEKKKKKK
ncbi:MAG: membrane protein insertase YidC [Anaerolineaceae bacterium]|nr:membrane protein insertase YidC [Anaerolineaceae bacterium]